MEILGTVIGLLIFLSPFFLAIGWVFFEYWIESTGF